MGHRLWKMRPGFAISNDFPLIYCGQCPLAEVIWTQSSFVGWILKWAEMGSAEPHPRVCLLDPHMRKPTFLTQLRWQQTKSRVFSHWDLHGVSPAPAHTSSHSSREAALTGLAFTMAGRHGCACILCCEARNRHLGQLRGRLQPCCSLAHRGTSLWLCVTQVLCSQQFLSRCN